MIGMHISALAGQMEEYTGRACTPWPGLAKRGFYMSAVHGPGLLVLPLVRTLQASAVPLCTTRTEASSGSIWLYTCVHER